MLIRQTLLYLPAQFLAPAAQLLSVLVWTWWISPAEMGAFAIVTATQELAYLTSIAWFSVYALRYMPARDDSVGMGRYLGTETTIVLAATIPQLIAAWITVHVVHITEDATLAFAAVGALYVSRCANVHFAERARAQSAILAYTILQCAGPVGGLAAGLYAVSAYGPVAINLIFAYALAQAIGTLVALPLIGFALRPRTPNGTILREAIAFGGPMLGLFALAWTAENIIRYVVEYRAGAAAFGLMAVGWGLGQRAASFAAMLVTAAAFPIASRLLNEGNRNAALEQLSLNAALLFGVLLPAVAGLEVIGAPLADLAVAEAYRATTRDVLSLATLAGALHFLHVHVTDQVMVLEKRFGSAALVDLIEIAGVGLFAGIGLHYYDLVGAVAGAVAGSLLAVIVSAVIAVTRLGFRFPVPHLVRIVLATALMVAALEMLPLAATVWSITLAVFTGGGVYAGALALFYLPAWMPVLRQRLAARRG